MKKNLLQPSLLVTLIFAAFNTQAANRVDVETLNSPSARASLRLPSESLRANADVAERVGLIAGDMKATRSQTYANGTVVTRHEQFHKGVPVLGESVIEHRTSGTATPKMTGVVLQNLGTDLPNVKPNLSEADVLKLAKSKVQQSGTENDQVKLFIQLDKKNVARLVYSVSFFVPNATKPSRPHFVMDANTGAVLSQWEGYTHLNASGPGGNTKTGQYEYGVNRGPLVVSNNCAMDTANVTTVNMNGGIAKSTTPFQFTCSRNTFKAINGAFSPLNDAHYFGNATFSMFDAYLGLRPISQKLVMRVHFGNAYDNAGWTGSDVIFGDGGTKFFPLVSADSVAHEIAHGFTEENSNLINYASSGGMSEAFSDMAGEALEYFLTGKNDFKVGAEIVKSGEANRYMANPTLDGNSIDHASNYNATIKEHYLSGVYNKAFYLLATTPGWNTRKAFEVMADANRLYWNNFSSFNDGACGVEQAASNRGYKVADVTAAFNGVGVACDNYNRLVEQLYLAYVNRPAEPSGATFWVDRLKAAGAPKTVQELVAAYNTNPAVKSIIDNFGNSPESTAIYTGSASNIVNTIYLKELNRAADPGGLTFWSNLITNGSLPKALAPLSIMSGVLNNTTPAGFPDATTVARKTAISINFTAAVNTPEEISSYTTALAASKARQMLATVTASTNVIAFQATIDATIANIVTNH